MDFRLGLIIFLPLFLMFLLGIDKAKPLKGLCAACRRHEQSMWRLRVSLLGFLFVYFLALVLTGLPFYARVDVTGVMLIGNFVPLAFALVVLSVALGAAVGKRFQHHIWVPASR